MDLLKLQRMILKNGYKLNSRKMEKVNLGEFLHRNSQKTNKELAEDIRQVKKLSNKCVIYFYDLGIFKLASEI